MRRPLLSCMDTGLWQYTLDLAVYWSYCVEVFMVQDGSVDYQDTWDFLDRRMQDTANFSKGRKQLEDSLNDATKLFSAGVTTVRMP